MDPKEQGKYKRNLSESHKEYKSYKKDEVFHGCLYKTPLDPLDSVPISDIFSQNANSDFDPIAFRNLGKKKKEKAKEIKEFKVLPEPDTTNPEKNTERTDKKSTPAKFKREPPKKIPKIGKTRKPDIPTETRTQTWGEYITSFFW